MIAVKSGLNTIERLSTDSVYTMKDIPSGEIYYKKMLKALEGSEPFTYSDRLFGFPDRLLFPRGKPEGQYYKLFFYISPIDEAKTTTFEFPMFGKMLYDGKPMGFPLDRPLYSWYLDLPNLYFKDVAITYMKGEEGYYKAGAYYGKYEGKYEGQYPGSFEGKYNDKYEGQYPSSHAGKYYDKYEKYGKYGKYEKPLYTEPQTYPKFNI